MIYKQGPPDPTAKNLYKGVRLVNLFFFFYCNRRCVIEEKLMPPNSLYIAKRKPLIPKNNFIEPQDGVDKTDMYWKNIL